MESHEDTGQDNPSPPFRFHLRKAMLVYQRYVVRGKMAPILMSY